MSRSAFAYSSTATTSHPLRAAALLLSTSKKRCSIFWTTTPPQRRILVSSSSFRAREVFRCLSTTNNKDNNNHDWKNQRLEDKHHDQKNQNTSKNSSTSEASASEQLWQHWLEQLKSPPNMITVARVASAPVLSYFIVTHQYHAAFWGCFVAGCSDWLDGYLAKHHDMSTVLGTYLDPLADKILINVLSVSLWYTAILPTPLVLLWLGRDVILMGATYRHVAIHTKPGQAVWDPITVPLKINPTATSKVNTALQFLTLTVALIQPVFPIMDHNSTTALLLPGLCWITGGTTIASAFSYLDYSAFSKSGNHNSDNMNERVKR